MATFEPILKEILRTEGGLANDPDDTGGLTWQGVAYASHPNWPGFKIVKRIIALNPKSYQAFLNGKPQAINKALYAQQDLKELVVKFYEGLYWNGNRLAEIKDQQLARNVCDFGVNAGTSVGAKTLQRSVNTYYNEKKVLDVDGDVGNATISHVNACDPATLYGIYNAKRKAFYDDIIERKPVQVKFRRAWYSRIIPYRS